MAALGLHPRYVTHSCRHSYPTTLYRVSGQDLEVVQEQLGHASIKTTTVYARVTKEDKLRAAVEPSHPCLDSPSGLRVGS